MIVAGVAQSVERRPCVQTPQSCLLARESLVVSSILTSGSNSEFNEEYDKDG